jgi:predicted ester cyclase
MTSQDVAAMAACYAVDAVATAPDQSELKGPEAISSYLSQMAEAFPDAQYEPLDQYEAGNVAIDEGYFTGTNTGQIQMPQGESLPPTGRKLRLRSCDVARVEGGLIVSHHFYWDQLDFLRQLGLLPETDPGIL